MLVCADQLVSTGRLLIIDSIDCVWHRKMQLRTMELLMQRPGLEWQEWKQLENVVRLVGWV